MGDFEVKETVTCAMGDDTTEIMFVYDCVIERQLQLLRLCGS
jgi:hypothetical protein